MDRYVMRDIWIKKNFFVKEMKFFLSVQFELNFIGIIWHVNQVPDFFAFILVPHLFAWYVTDLYPS